EDPVRVESVFDARRVDDRLVVDCLVSVRPAAEGRPLPLLLVLKGDPGARLSASTQVEPTDRYQLRALRFTFKGVPADALPEAVIQEPRPPRRVPVSWRDAAAVAGGDVLLRVADFPAWQRTFETLKAAPAFAGWSARIGELGHDLSATRLSETDGAV